jgi:UDP-N-acetyl-D-mannosaminuronic acid transferase (WecB/TagA/CpsF family)
MQDRGLEWLFRLVQEPKRLWSRYLILNPLYVWGLAKQKLGVSVKPVLWPDGNERIESFG